jgi:hypothetical protein
VNTYIDETIIDSESLCLHSENYIQNVEDQELLKSDDLSSFNYTKTKKLSQQ